MSALESLLREVEAEAPARTTALDLAAELSFVHGSTISPELRRFLETVSTHRVEDLDRPRHFYGDTDIVGRDPKRPFLDAMLRNAADFNGGFGLLQVALPMVPLLSVDGDCVLALLDDRDDAGIVALPQDALFDLEASKPSSMRRSFARQARLRSSATWHRHCARRCRGAPLATSIFGPCGTNERPRASRCRAGEPSRARTREVHRDHSTSGLLCSRACRTSTSMR